MNIRSLHACSTSVLAAWILASLLGSAEVQAQSAAVALTATPAAVGPITRGGQACAGGEIYDDGSAENGYSGNPSVVTSFQGVMQFTPAAYPATYSSVCVGLVSLGGAALDFQIQVHDDDGAGGTPGTLLGSVPVSVTDLPGGLPCTFYTVDVSSLGLNVASGSVHVGVQWDPSVFPSRFICSDESPATTLRLGHINFNTGDGWQTTETLFPAYRAKLLRAVGGPVSADLGLTKTSDAAGPVTVGSPVTFTLTAENLGPALATSVVVTDTLPAQLAHVSNTCGATVAGNVVTWNIGSLAAATNEICQITANVVGTGDIVNTASIAGAEGDANPANNAASASITAAAPQVPVPGIGVLGILLLAGLVLFAVRRRTSVARLH